jgi:hypothetical protein
MILNQNGSSKSYRDSLIKDALPVASVDVYSKIIQEYSNRESLSTDTAKIPILAASPSLPSPFPSPTVPVPVPLQPLTVSHPQTSPTVPNCPQPSPTVPNRPEPSFILF